MKRAEQHLLEALYGHISSLGKFESDTLLEEDPDIMQRRAASKKVGMRNVACYISISDVGCAGCWEYSLASVYRRI